MGPTFGMGTITKKKKRIFEELKDFDLDKLTDQFEIVLS
jgi:hypothetical protein